MQIQIRSVDAQVKGLQFSLNKLASKDELAAVQHNADFRIGEVEQRLDATRQEMESRCQRMDESIHDLSDRVTSVEQKQSASVQQVRDARSDSRSIRQPVSLVVSDHIDMYHTPVGMGEFPRPVLHSTMRKVAEGPPISVSTHFTPISSMLDLGSGLGAHIHSGTPAAAVDVSGVHLGPSQTGCTVLFYPRGRRRPWVSHRLWVSLRQMLRAPSLIHIARFCRLYNQAGLWRRPFRLIRRVQIPLTSGRVSIILEMRLSALRNHQWKCPLLMLKLVTGPPLFKILRIWL